MSSGKGNKTNEESLKKSFQSISKDTIGSKLSSHCTSATSCENLSQTCSVCAEFEPKFWSFSSCSHKICWICSLRLRFLYGSKACPICKSQSESVFICKRSNGDGDKVAEFFKTPNKSSIGYDNEMTRSCCETLLKIQCPFNNNQNHSNFNFNSTGVACGKHFKNKFELRKHVQSSHELQVCEICLEYKKCFSVELALYNRTSLQKHQRDANHPRCQVCERIFYSEDELMEHCRDEHELCHICQRSGRPNRHFQNYSKLEEHFSKEHFLCPEALCKELKFVVFENELEYKAHQAEVHLSHQKLQRSQQRQLQRLNISFGSAETTAHIPSSSSSSPSPLKLTGDQRNQIGSSLVFGEVTDDLANRLQSLSLYQNRNDEFLESLRGGNLNLSQNQLQVLFKDARSYQNGDCSATELLLKIETILKELNSNLRGNSVLKIAIGLSDLQLDDMKKQRLHVAINEYKEKCMSFPELKGNGNGVNGKRLSTLSWANNSKTTPTNDEDEKETDPFGFARRLSSNQNQKSNQHIPPGFSSKNPFSNSSVKVLQIHNPASTLNSPMNPPSKTSDPSRNPALLLSQLAGGPATKTTKKKSTVKMTSSFSSVAVGSVNTNLKFNNKTDIANSKLNESEFPSLIGGSSGSSSSNTSSNVVSVNTNTTNAFFAPSNRDQLESFTIGNDDSEAIITQTTTPIKKEKKTKKVLFRYGQKWDV